MDIIVMGFEHCQRCSPLAWTSVGNSFEDSMIKQKCNLFKAIIYFVFYFDRMPKSANLDLVL